MIRHPHRAAAMLAALLWPLTALADTIHVAPCGSDAWTGASAVCVAPDGPKATIQAAIDAAASGDTVLVADGTYTGPGNRDIDFRGKAVTLRSASGAAAAVIDIQASAAGPARAFVFYSGETASTVIEGFTIRGGWMSRGGAVLCERGSAPEFRACVFRDNVAAQEAFDDGGGAVYNLESSPSFIDCRFVGNRAQLIFPEAGGGAVRNEFRSSPIFIRCEFEQNVAAGPSTSGGAVMSYNLCHPEFFSCTFVGNESTWGGGVTMESDSSATLEDCEFRGNRAIHDGFSGVGSGGALGQWFGGASKLVRCRFIDNQANWHCGAIYPGIGVEMEFIDCIFIGNGSTNSGAIGAEYDTALLLTNCFFTRNTGAGGAVWIADRTTARLVNCTFNANSGAVTAHREARFTIDNSILYGNGGSEIRTFTGSTADATYSNIRGGWPGVGNISANPLWVDHLGGDFRLSASSPCIDAGDNTAVPAGILSDLAGLPRFVDDPATPDTGVGPAPVVDMGAYEFQVACYADCDASGALDFFDFLCFQNQFAAGDPEADCDGSGDLDFFDFLCFQNAFAAGCE